MSPYLAGGMLLGFIAWSGGMFMAGSRNESDKCKAADAQVTAAAYQHKDEVTIKETGIAQSEGATYEQNFNTIGTLYSNGLPTSSIASMPVIPAPIARACTNRSRKYKLSFEQCDIEEAKLKALFDTDMKLSAIK